VLKILFEFTIKPGNEKHFLEELALFKEKCQQKKGCLFYNYLQHQNQFFLIEIWESEEDFNAHQNSDNLQEFRKKVVDLLLCPRVKYVL
jgi:quinol monooxygenase YgiN